MSDSDVVAGIDIESIWLEFERYRAVKAEERIEEFLQHIRECVEEVSGWPEWKKNLLVPLRSQ